MESSFCTFSHFCMCKTNTSCIASSAVSISHENKSLGISSTCIWCVRHFMECCKPPGMALDLCILAISKHISSGFLHAHGSLVPLTPPCELSKLAFMHQLRWFPSPMKVSPKKYRQVDCSFFLFSFPPFFLSLPLCFSFFPKTRYTWGTA